VHPTVLAGSITVAKLWNFNSDNLIIKKSEQQQRFLVPVKSWNDS